MVTARRRFLEVELTSPFGPFQPTGFPDLGMATYSRPVGTDEWMATCAVESPQSLARHMSSTVWDEARLDQIELIDGLPYVRIVDTESRYLTSSRQESHRLAGAYVLDGVTADGVPGSEWLQGLLAPPEATRQPPLRDLAAVVYELDPLALIHGSFWAIRAWRWQPKLTRAVFASLAAEDISPAVRGGVKTDRVRTLLPDGSALASGDGYGSIPHGGPQLITARRIVLNVCVDDDLLRAYGLGPARTEVLSALVDYELAAFLGDEGDGLRLRSECILSVGDRGGIPTLAEATDRLAAAMKAAGEVGTVHELVWDWATKTGTRRRKPGVKESA